MIDPIDGGISQAEITASKFKPSAIPFEITQCQLCSLSKSILTLQNIRFHSFVTLSLTQSVTACRVGWPGPCGPGIRVEHRCKGGSALCLAATPSEYKNAASEKTSKKYL